MLARILRTTLFVLIASYGLSVSFMLLLRFVIGESWNIIALYNTLAHLLWMPALALLPLALLWRRWRLAALLLPPAAAFIFTYGALFRPHDSGVAMAQDSSGFTVLTYNMGGQTRPRSPVVDLILEADADIVAMQELSVHMASHFYRTMSEHYPYMALHPVADNLSAGNGVLSRFPIVSDDYWQYDWLWDPQGHQRVVLDIGGMELVLYNLHLKRPSVTRSFFNATDRGLELDDLLQRLDAEEGLVVLAGDFNMPDLSDDYARVTARYTDAFRAVGRGMGFTFPDLSQGGWLPYRLARIPFFTIPPVLRIDYVFYNDWLRATEAQVWDHSGGSDHRPLFVSLSIMGAD